jgi:hypothetical protein
VVLSSRSRRHLVVATGAWAGRTIPGEPMPYYRLGLLHPADPPADATADGIDVDACPSLAEVLEVRENRMALVRGIPGGSPAPDWNWPARACPAPGLPGGSTLGRPLPARGHDGARASPLRGLAGLEAATDARTARPGAAS